ncbi:MAG: ATP-binding protein, partial [Nitrospirae bacterium]
PEQMKRALINLIDNAISASAPSGGEVSVEVLFNSDDKLVTIDVKDTGSGIPEEIKEKLFLPYFSTKKEGTGLGLAIVNRIVSEHGGRISVKNNKPGGSIFRIEIPAA